MTRELARLIVAITCIVSGTILIICGFDGVVGSILIAIVAFYFGWQKTYPNSDEECKDESVRDSSTPGN